MERVCGVCGGQKKELFSSTYCPRCEGDEQTNPGPITLDDWLTFEQVKDVLIRRGVAVGFAWVGSARSTFRDAAVVTFHRLAPSPTTMGATTHEYFDALVLGSGAPRSVVEYFAKCMGAP